jgi:hypothetical protein
LWFIDLLHFPLTTELPFPFDVNIHKIPSRAHEPEHFHYDIRYLFVAAPHAKIQISEESPDLKWIGLDDVAHYTQEPTTLTQVEKIKFIIQSSCAK